MNEAADYYNSLDAELQEQVAAVAAEQQNSAVAAAVQVAQDTTAQAAAKAAAEDASAKDDGADQSSKGQSGSTADEDSSKSDSGPSSGGSSNIPSGGGVAAALAAAEAGAPYVYGATGPDSFDCSGLVCYCYGYARGRTTYDMIDSLQSTGSWKSSMSQLEYGDLCFTSEGHVGIYLGNGQMVHAPSPGRSVCVTTVWACIGGGTY